MDNQIKSKIIEILENYLNPISKKPFMLGEEINLVIKNGHANLSININPDDISKYEKVKEELENKISSVENVLSANVVLTAERKAAEKGNQDPRNNKYELEVKNIIAIASGKGGVGKSTVAVNTAIALSALGKSVVLLDADIYGPSIPKMMGISGKPISNKEKKFVPLENYGIKCMSIGFLLPTDTPTIWRGPMIMKALEQLFISVEWGSPDYMIVDLPPGTGDTQITMAQKVPLKGAIIVSTPQDIALIDARKGINMFNKVNVPVIGIIENMSYFICDKCNQRHEIFSYGGAKNEAKKLDTEFLGEVPLDKNLRISSDEGKPIGIFNQNSDIAKKYIEIANKIINI
ncbi:MAG: Iron-sulfur cluster carrier protein [Alphaproteobacteria bacterium MarineAlpha5_Bin11]|nr:sodium:proton antiporter [Pelagibacteraceae bacterium]PPR43731.1 MAG: Iron-sulfur cluster carrier protein [Alphaproteobacteria bacterium MarineAlpha5_Bin11]PPR50511.1 MAG: Iron-sulfur cluster carrier protein [Alphaproteobacteria bacterium MarineAlpha5_Bin10]|tara:strand:+ start:3640 stop:4680 length:1041 start_codon:yes stop_codon:yes gene_type:complete